jgi:hypothetical protein
LILKSYNIPDSIIESWNYKTIGKAIQLIRKIELQRGYYHYDVQDYSRLINAKPRKKDGSFDKSEYDKAINQAIDIRKRQLQVVEKEPKPFLIDYITETVSVSQYIILKPFLSHLKILIHTITAICSNLGQ